MALDNMNRRLQIVISHRTAPHEPGSAQPTHPVSRLKTFVVGLGLAVISVAILIAGLILGSVLAAVLCILLMGAIVILVLKVAIRRARQ